MSRPTPDWLTSTPIAHRGLHDKQAPENSLAAFERAIEQGFAIEFDVHLSSDGVPVIFHDDDTERMTGKRGIVEADTAAELTSESLSGSIEHIPTLDAALEHINGRTPLLIEIKNEGRVGPLEAAVLARLHTYHGAFVIQSFNPFSILFFKRRAPGIIRGQLAGDFRDRPDIRGLKKFVLRHMLLNFWTRPDFISYDIDALGERGLARLRRRYPAQAILLWVVRTPAERLLAARYRCNTIFENPSA